MLNLFFFSCKVEEIYKNAHAAIRKDPSPKPRVRSKPPQKKRWNRAKITLAERKNCIAQKKEAFLKKVRAGEIEA